MNLYLPVYTKLEQEVVELTNSIFFDDKQLKTYSLAIGDIIVRCSIETEAIAKELYLRLGGVEHPVDSAGKTRDLYFDTDCMAMLIEKWKINEKQLQITNPNMYFSSSKSILTPLYKSDKRGTSGSRWKQAYQNIKHNRSQTITWATVENLLNALGAAYILNCYYADEHFWSETPIQGRREFSASSKIFSPFIADASGIHMGKDMGDLSLPDDIINRSIYVRRQTIEAYSRIHKLYCEATVKYAKKLLSPESYDQLKNKPEEERAKDLNFIADQIGFSDLATLKHTLADGDFSYCIRNKEVIVNKHESIYPTLRYLDYINSEEGIKMINERS